MYYIELHFKFESLAPYNMYSFISSFSFYGNLTCLPLFLDVEYTVRQFKDYSLFCSIGASVCGKLSLILAVFTWTYCFQHYPLLFKCIIGQGIEVIKISE